MKTVYIILSFCAGLFLGYLLFPSDKAIEPPVITQLNETKEQLAIIDSGYSSNEAVYKKQSDSLAAELKGYKRLLSNARKELAIKREKISDVLNLIKQDSVFRSDPLMVDSLSGQITKVNQFTDSLLLHYEKRDTILQRLVAVRDTQIVLCNRSYQEIKNLAEEQRLREQKLTVDLNTALKQQRKNRLQNRILAGGMLFISGIATTLYIKSRQ